MTFLSTHDEISTTVGIFSGALCAVLIFGILALMAFALFKSGSSLDLLMEHRNPTLRERIREPYPLWTSTVKVGPEELSDAELARLRDDIDTLLAKRRSGETGDSGAAQ